MSRSRSAIVVSASIWATLLGAGCAKGSELDDGSVARIDPGDAGPDTSTIDATGEDGAHDVTSTNEGASDVSEATTPTDAGDASDAHDADDADDADDAIADAASDPADAIVDAPVDVALDAADATSDVFADGATDVAIPDGGFPSTDGEVSIDAGQISTQYAAVTLYLVPAGNLVANGGFESGETGWSLTPSGDGWNNATGYHVFGAHAEQGSYERESIATTVDLVAAGWTAASLDASPTFDVGTFLTSTGVSSNPADTYAVHVSLQDASGTELGLWDSGDGLAPIDSWSSVAHEMTLPVGTRQAVVTLDEQDGEFWAGYYGAAFDGVSVVVGGLPQVRISNDGSTWTAWQAFAPTIPWTLSAASTPAHVYVEFRDPTTLASLGVATDTIGILVQDAASD